MRLDLFGPSSETRLGGGSGGSSLRRPKRLERLVAGFGGGGSAGARLEAGGGIG